VLIGVSEYRPVVLAPYNPAWPARYAAVAADVLAALGERVLRLEHIGSTSVPGLAAKPIVDALLIVADPAAEDDYVPDLLAAGFALRVREPDFHGHRMLRTASRDVHFHILPPDCVETVRYLAFRDRLRAEPAERRRYAEVKRELAGRDWPTMDDYADAKSEVVEHIIARGGGPPRSSQHG
jgi:GrpB-like predicted nucleotidyltransferase (UPF0157 family)